MSDEVRAPLDLEEGQAVRVRDGLVRCPICGAALFNPAAAPGPWCGMCRCGASFFFRREGLRVEVDDAR